MEFLSTFFILIVFYYFFAVFYHLMCVYLGISKPPLQESHIMVVFGSGGHTTEMLLLLKNLNFTKYGAITFVVGHSDTFSEEKIKDFYKKNRNISLEKDVPHLMIVRLFRSREVKQSYLTSVFTTLLGLFYSIKLIFQSKPDLVTTSLNTLPCFRSLQMVQALLYLSAMPIS